MVMLFISFDGLSYTIPVNPKELTISQSASNANIDIVGLGKATRKGQPGPRTLKIQSFFPNPKSPFYFNIPASTYIEFIEKIWNTENINNKVATISSYGLINDIASKEINMPFVIEKFDYKYTGGDFDTEYTLSIKEYIPYGVKTTTNFSIGMQSARQPSTVKSNIPALMQDTQPTTEAKTYTIVSGDTLWTIAKRATGDGNNWKALYELNKNKIGTNPNYIKSGTVLTLPENWNSPQAKNNTATTKTVYNQGKNTGNITKSVLNTNTDTQINTFSQPLGPKVELKPELQAALLQRQINKDIENLNSLSNKLQSSKNASAGVKSDVTRSLSSWSKELQNKYTRAKNIVDNPDYSSSEKSKAIKNLSQEENMLYLRYSGLIQANI